MKQTLSTSQAAHELLRDEYANWTRAGAFALVEYLEQLEEDMGETIEFDPVAIRCDYSEHSSALEAAIEQGFEPSMEGEDASEREAMEFLRWNTQVIEFEGGIIIQSF